MTTVADPQQINIDAAIVIAPKEPPVRMEELLVIEESTTSLKDAPTDVATAVAVVVENPVVAKGSANIPEEASSSAVAAAAAVIESSSVLNVTPVEMMSVLTPDPVATPALSSVGQTTTEPASPFRGQCKYKSGKCNNERAKKRNGQAHTLCDYHRIRQNAHQRKSDRKHRESMGASAAAAAVAVDMASGDLTPEETLALATTGDGAIEAATKKSKKRSYAKTAGGGQKEKELAALRSLSSMQYQQQQKEAEEMVKKQRLVMMMNDENTDHNSVVSPDPDSNVSATVSMEQLLDSSSVAALMMKETVSEVVSSTSSTDAETFKNMVIDI